MVDRSEAENVFHFDAYALYDALVKSTDDYIYIVDMANDISLVSDNMYRDFALPGNFVKGLVPVWGDLIHEKDQERYYASITDMMDGKSDQHNVEYQIRNRKHEYIWVVCRGVLKRDAEGKPEMFAGVVTQIDRKGKSDPTTGLFTQEECKKRVEALFEKGNASGGLLLLGMDDFKRINNLRNHTFGDLVLRKIGQDIQQMVPLEAEVYRFDGDEKAIFYPGASLDDMSNLYTAIHMYANREHAIDGVPYICTLSGGIAMIDERVNSYLDLIKYAMSALEASKNKGKNMCTVFTEELLHSNLRNMDIMNHIQHSVLNEMEGFSLVYQPFVDADFRVKGAEALLRWRCDAYDAVGPAEFVPLLESGGCIVQVGRWVLEQAVKTCRRWIHEYPDFIMNINVSYLQVIDREFVPYIEQLLKSYDLEGRHVVLELTESYFVTDMPALQETFDGLHKLGVCIAMDDFGTGYSSLGMLTQIPADIVKIDRMFITLINRKDHMFNRSFIKAVIELCHSVGISVCVEGVEYVDELETVRALDADSIQGYYVSRPITLERFEERYLKEKVS